MYDKLDNSENLAGEHRAARPVQCARCTGPVRLLLLASLFSIDLTAQELQPRAYIPAPVGLNFFSFGYSDNRGGLLFDPSLPVEDSHVQAGATHFAFAQTLGVMGRTAQVLAVLPYVTANIDCRYAGSEQHLYRSGLGDAVIRYAMNICGAPAMGLKEFSQYRQKPSSAPASPCRLRRACTTRTA